MTEVFCAHQQLRNCQQIVGIWTSSILEWALAWGQTPFDQFAGCALVLRFPSEVLRENRGIGKNKSVIECCQASEVGKCRIASVALVMRSDASANWRSEFREAVQNSVNELSGLEKSGLKELVKAVNGLCVSRYSFYQYSATETFWRPRIVSSSEPGQPQSSAETRYPKTAALFLSYHLVYITRALAGKSAYHRLSGVNWNLVPEPFKRFFNKFNPGIERHVDTTAVGDPVQLFARGHVGNDNYIKIAAWEHDPNMTTTVDVMRDVMSQASLRQVERAKCAVQAVAATRFRFREGPQRSEEDRLRMYETTSTVEESSELQAAETNAAPRL